MSFQVGQKVVCVDDVPKPGRTFTSRLKVGEIYTIARLAPNPSGILAIWPLGHISKNGFHARRFRPVIERKTDISVFQKMLTPTDKVSA